MTSQNPRDMRDYMRTLERLSASQRALPDMVKKAVDEVKEEEKEAKARRPAAPIELVAQSAFYFDEVMRKQLVLFLLDFPDVIFNTDGTKASIQQYELWGRPVVAEGATEGPWELQTTSVESSFRFDRYVPNSQWLFRARALGMDAVQPGEWSEEITVRMVKDTVPPPQPSAPVVTVTRGVLTVSWDGKAVNGDMPADFEYAILAHDIVTSPTREVDRFTREGGFKVIADLKYQVMQYFRIRAVDESGNLGPWSAVASGFTKPLVDGDLILSELDAAKTQIINAGKLIMESGVELGNRLDASDEALAATEKKLTGPGGLTERLTGAEKKLNDVGALNFADGQTLRQKIAASDTAIGTAQGQLDTVRNTTLPKLTTDLSAATGRLSTAEGKITAAQSDLTTAKTDIAAAKKSITDNKTVMDGAVVRLTAAEGEITGAKTRLGTAESKIATLANTTLPALTTDLDAAKGRLDTAQNTLNLIPGDIASAKAAAIAAAVSEAEAKDKAALATAATDAQTKATKALTDAKADSLAKTNAVRAEALAAATAAAESARAAAGLAGKMGRTWFQPEAPPAGTVYAWTGARGLSRSTAHVDGVLSRTNLVSNPSFDSSLSGWSHTNATWKVISVKAGAIPEAAAKFFGTSSAMEMTWEEGGINGAYIGNTFPAALTKETPVHGEMKIFGLEGETRIRVSAECYGADNKVIIALTAAYSTVGPGQQQILTADGMAPVGTTRVVFTLYRNGVVPPSKILVSRALFEVGTSGSYFDGDTPDEREFDLWIDTDEGNTPKRWNGTAWTAVTDQKAIDAAIAAAAADATSKADAALATAKEDATAKAEAARAAAVATAATDAQNKATAAQRAAEEAAAATAQAKVDEAKSVTLTAAAADAKKKADDAQRLATEAAATEAQLKANGAKTDAIAAAAIDAKKKADDAQRLATEAASADATAKANKALADATTAAASIATEKANAAQAAAINASALDASFKADEAERRAKAVAATAQTAADKAIADALAASGLAGSKGKTLFQATAPGAADRNAQTLWVDTTGGANTPKRWTTGTTWVAVTDKVAVDAASAAAQAVSDASAAAAAARTAQSTADSAMSAAGSKNNIFYSPDDANGIAAVGDTWRKVDASQNIIGEWRYTSNGKWLAQLVTTEMISNLDVGKLTAGTAAINDLVARRIAAGTAAFQKADIGNLTVTADSLLNNVVAQKIAAGVGEFISVTTDQLTAGSATLGDAVARKIAAGTAAFQKADISNLTAGSANMTQAVIDKLVANTAAFQKVTVDNITATTTANLNSVVAQRIAAGTASFQTVDAKNLFVTGTSSLDTVVAKRLAAETGEFINLSVDQLVVTGSAKLKEVVANRLFADIFTANKIGAAQITVSDFTNFAPNLAESPNDWELTGGMQIIASTAGGANDGFRFNAPIQDNAAWANGPTKAANPGESFYGEVTTYRGNGAGGRAINLYWEFLNASRASIALSPQTESQTAAGKLTNRAVAPVGTAFARLRLGVSGSTGGPAGGYAMNGYRQTGATLIEPGSVTTEHITVTKELSAKVGTFLELDVSQLRVAGGATINDAVITKLWTDVVRSRQITTDMLRVGNGNLILDPSFVAAPIRQMRISIASTGLNPTFTQQADGLFYMRANSTSATTFDQFMFLRTGPASSGNMIGVTPGEKYLLEMEVWADGGVRWLPQLDVLYGNNTSGVFAVNDASIVGTGGWVVYSFEAVIPAGVAEVYPRFRINTGSTGYWRMRSPLFKAKATASVIVNGAILTKHLTVTSDMTAALLKAKKVEAIEIDANSLTADTGFIGVLRGGILINDAIDTKHIRANAIDAKHTITGALVRTAASGARTEMTKDGFRQLSSSGVELVKIGYGIETGMSMRRPSTGKMEPLGNLVFGTDAYDATLVNNRNGSNPTRLVIRGGQIGSAYIKDYNNNEIVIVASADTHLLIINHEMIWRWVAAGNYVAPPVAKYMVAVHVYDSEGRQPPGYYAFSMSFLGRYDDISNWSNMQMATIRNMVPGSSYKVMLRITNAESGSDTRSELLVGDVQLISIPL